MDITTTRSSRTFGGDATQRTRERLLRATYWAAVAVVFLAFTAATLHRIGNYWQWGHDGFNGAAFSNGARNSIRFHMSGPAIFHFGTERPKDTEIETRHPQLIHFHLIAAQVLFGFGEWVGRTVPAFYSVASLVMLFVLTRKYYGDARALAAAAIYCVLPINLIFSHMVDHEQGGIFWIAALLYTYLAWLEHGRKRDLVLTLVFVSFATQFDWPAYYAALWIFLHAIAVGWFRNRRVWSWQPHYTFGVLFSVVVLGNAALFFGWHYAMRGSLDEMTKAFLWRTQSPPGYAAHVYDWLQIMHGELVTFALAAWLLLATGRVLGGKPKLADFIPLCFFLTQTTHSFLFKHAGWIHSYWTYYYNPAMAVGGADAAVTCATFLCVRLPAWAGSAVGYLTRRPALPALFWLTVRRSWQSLVVLVAFWLLWSQAAFAWQQFRWGLDTGNASMVGNYDDQYAEAMWFKDVTRRYRRDDVFYFVVDPDGFLRVELQYYLDTDHERIGGIAANLPLKRGRSHTLLMVDTRRPHDHALLAQLAARHPTTVWDQRFVTIDLAARGPRFTSLVAQPEPATWCWKWLVHPSHPPMHWRQDRRWRDTLRLLVPPKDAAPAPTTPG